MAVLYVCGRINGNTWDFQGVFDTPFKARNACRDKTFFVAPAVLNEVLDMETTDWPGIEFMNDKGEWK